jgi:hypothetical protein
MIPESLTVRQLQERRNQLTHAIEELLVGFVRETGVIVHVDKCHASPGFTDDSIELDVSVYCGLSAGLERASLAPKLPP